MISFVNESIIPIFLLIALGYFLKYKRFVSQEFLNVATRFGFYVTLPCSLFLSIYKNGKIQISDITFMAYAVLMFFIMVGVLVAVASKMKLTSQQRGAFIQGAFRSNFLILGLPLAQNLFGLDGIAPTAMLLAIMIPLFNITAVVIFTLFQDKDFSSIHWGSMLFGMLKNPLVIGAALGIVISNTGIVLPKVIYKSVSDLAGIATPFALIVLGGQFDLSKVKGNISLSLLASALRVAVIPLIIVSLSVALGYRGPHLGALYLLFSAPTALTSYVMAKEMSSDDQLTAQIIVLSTIGSLFTLSVGVYVLKLFSLI